MGKHKHSKAMGYLHISCVALIHTIPKIWEKWIPRVRKNMGKHKHFKVKCFWNFSLEAENHAVLKTWEKWICIIRKKHGETQAFQIYGFLKYFGWSRNSYNSQNMGKVNSHNTGKVWEKSKHSKVLGFSNILGEAEIHTIPKIWEKWIPIVREKYGKAQTFQS